jgi:hypothetical protein
MLLLMGKINILIRNALICAGSYLAMLVLLFHGLVLWNCGLKRSNLKGFLIGLLLILDLIFLGGSKILGIRGIRNSFFF